MLTFTDTELRHIGVALEFYLSPQVRLVFGDAGDRPHAATALAKVLDEIDQRGIVIDHIQDDAP